jgi:hypothetical protein
MQQTAKGDLLCIILIICCVGMFVYIFEIAEIVEKHNKRQEADGNIKMIKNEINN